MSENPTVVAVNGSPHAGAGNTSMMIEMLRDPLSQEGFQLDVINPSVKSTIVMVAPFVWKKANAGSMIIIAALPKGCCRPKALLWLRRFMF